MGLEHWADWFPWVVLGVLAVVAQVWTPRTTGRKQEQAGARIEWLERPNHSDDGTQR